MYIHKSYPYEHFRRLSRQILEIDEVAAGVSLSTGTSPTTKNTTTHFFPGMGQKVTCSYKESEATVAIDDPPLKMHF